METKIIMTIEQKPVDLAIRDLDIKIAEFDKILDTALIAYDEQASIVIDQAKTIKVETRELYDVANAYTKAGKDLGEKIVTFCEPLRKKADELHKMVTRNKKKHLKPIEDAIDIFKSKTTSWYMEEQRKVREQEEKIRREAIRQQEEARLKEAEELEKNGEAEKAEEILSAPILAPVFKPQKIEKPEGVSYHDNWKFEIVDESKIPRDYLMPDEKEIGRTVKARKEKTNIPGIRAYNDPFQVNS